MPQKNKLTLLRCINDKQRREQTGAGFLRSGPHLDGEDVAVVLEVAVGDRHHASGGVEREILQTPVGEGEEEPGGVEGRLGRPPAGVKGQVGVGRLHPEDLHPLVGGQ